MQKELLRSTEEKRRVGGVQDIRKKIESRIMILKRRRKIKIEVHDKEINFFVANLKKALLKDIKKSCHKAN